MTLGETRIPLWGDSITEGKPGASYVERLESLMPELDFINFGKGGDTIKSLQARLGNEPLPADNKKAPIALLWVGVNDVYADLIPGYGIWKAAMKQTPTRQDQDFATVYRSILTALSGHTEQIIVLSPLFVGEDPGFELNRRLLTIADIINSVAADFPNTVFLDIRKLMPLSAIDPSPFLPVNPWSKLTDALAGVEDEYFDKASERRKLLWTYDGIHLNSHGADHVAKIISVSLKELLPRNI